MFSFVFILANFIINWHPKIGIVIGSNVLSDRIIVHKSVIAYYNMILVYSSTLMIQHEEVVNGKKPARNFDHSFMKKKSAVKRTQAK